MKTTKLIPVKANKHQYQGRSAKEILDGLVYVADWLEQNHSSEDIPHWIYANHDSSVKRHKQMYAALQAAGMTQKSQDEIQSCFLRGKTHHNIDKTTSAPSWMSNQVREISDDTTQLYASSFMLCFGITQSRGYFEEGSMQRYLESRNIPFSHVLGNYWEQVQVHQGKRSVQKTVSNLEALLTPSQINGAHSEVQLDFHLGDIYLHQDRIIHKWKHCDFGSLMLFMGGAIHDKDGVIQYGFHHMDDNQLLSPKLISESDTRIQHK